MKSFYYNNKAVYRAILKTICLSKIVFITLN